MTVALIRPLHQNPQSWKLKLAVAVAVASVALLVLDGMMWYGHVAAPLSILAFHLGGQGLFWSAYYTFAFWRSRYKPQTDCHCSRCIDYVLPEQEMVSLEQCPALDLIAQNIVHFRKQLSPTSPSEQLAQVSASYALWHLAFPRIDEPYLDAQWYKTAGYSAHYGSIIKGLRRYEQQILSYASSLAKGNGHTAS